jgi:hypothetical protein
MLMGKAVGANAFALLSINKFQFGLLLTMVSYSYTFAPLDLRQQGVKDARRVFNREGL